MSNNITYGKRTSALLPYFCSLLFCVFFSITAYGQASHQLTSFPNVISIAEDKHGYIWLAGQNGVSRFDSSNILNHSTDSDQWQLPFVWAHSIKAFNNEVIISTEKKGVWSINAESNSATKIAAQLPNDTVYAITFFKNNYYINTMAPNNLYRYNPLTDKTQLLKNNIYIKEFASTEDRLLYFSSDGTLEEILEPETSNPLATTNIVKVATEPVKALVARNNTVAYVTDTKLVKLTAEKRFEVLATKDISAIGFDNQGKDLFAIDSQSNIYKYSDELKLITHGYRADLSATVTSLHHDKSGALWLITGQGTERITEENYRSHPKILNVAINAIDVEKYQNNIVIGSYGGGLQNLGNQSFIPTEINEAFTKNGLIITDLQAVGDDLYISTFDGLWKYQHRDKILKPVKISEESLILLGLTYKDDTLYISTDEHGFIIYDTKNQMIKLKSTLAMPLNSHEVIDILPVNENLWLATANGVNVFNTKTQEISRINLPGSSKAMSIVKAQRKIFVCTNGDGIFVFNQQQEMLSHFAMDNNFTHLSYYKGKIWAPSKAGLYTIDPASNKISMHAGTEKYAFTGDVIFHQESIYVGYYGGVLEVPQSDDNIYNAPIVISQTTVSGKTYLNSIDVKTDSKNDVISFELASLDYRIGTEKRFQYKVNDSLWNDVSGDQITLTGLTSGNYEIEIKGTNSLGQWSANRAYATISVAYPWYWTLQMRIIYVVALICTIAITVWLFYLRANSISKVHHLLENELKNKGKRSVSINRSLNLVQELLEHNNLDDAKKIIQQSIDELESNNVNNEPDSLYGNSLSVALPFFGEYLHRKYHISLHCQLEYNEDQLDYEFQASIYKIVYEAVTSALLNTESRSFHVQIQEFKSKLWLTITDDENCFSHFNSVITFDMAMYYVRQIADKYNASVNTFDAQDDKGSQLIVSFPLMPLT